MRIRNKKEKNEVIQKWTLVIITSLFIALEFQAITLESHYKYDLVMCIFLLFALFTIKNYLHLHWFHYLLFSVFLVLHGLGMYQLYDKFPFGIEYDYWIHGFFGFVSSLILIRAFVYSSAEISVKTAILMTMVLVLGISAAHELYEFAGAMLFGEGEGVLFIGAGDMDEWDTQKDMLNNVVGSVIGIFAFLAYRKTAIIVKK